MKYVAVLPWIHKPYRDAFIETCKLDVFEIDNTQHNLGIMRSHNLAIDKMREENADWLIVMSAAIRFGPAGGLDFVAALDNYFICISAASEHTLKASAQVGVYGWHLIAFSRECIEKVGKWDENFSPYGWDDIDYSIRMQKAFPDPEYSRRTKKVPIDVYDTTMAHSINLAGVQTDNNHHIKYIESKWGAILHGDGKVNDVNKYNDTPFNSGNPVSWWPTEQEAMVLLNETSN